MATDPTNHDPAYQAYEFRARARPPISRLGTMVPKIKDALDAARAQGLAAESASALDGIYAEVAAAHRELDAIGTAADD